MPRRETKLISGYIYHVYNRGVARQRTFTSKEEYSRAINLINYYRFANTPLRYSLFIHLNAVDQNAILKQLKTQNEIFVEILTFKLMPNHFHFTLKQVKDNGIMQFISHFANGYTKYFNTKNDRVGPLFQGRFQTILIETTEQLLHLSRYHHLNAYTAGVVKTLGDLLNYPYSSLPYYLKEVNNDFVETKTILSEFKNTSAYEKFILAHADYQKKMGRIKKLILEKPTKFVPVHPRRV